ncbi:hypothetical protein CEXT_509071 [Caerostris extrusa]|uniref:Uncharacterized protein n=1 Tax=Caerostris extrusa TaxID=172846 RepID=A0AAV4X3C8_CAEEX|nr:hypothetical protein CEXT_509071 [Caerostris extrusa]
MFPIKCEVGEKAKREPQTLSLIANLSTKLTPSFGQGGQIAGIVPAKIWVGHVVIMLPMYLQKAVRRWQNEYGDRAILIAQKGCSMHRKPGHG